MNNISLFNLLFGALVAGLMVSCMGMEDTDPSSMLMPEVKTFEVKDNGSLVFELTASIDKSLVGRVAECGFYYSKDKDMSDAEWIACKMTDNSFSAVLLLREYGKTFYICSYISNGSGSNYILSDSKKVQIKSLEDYVELRTPYVTSYDKQTKKMSVKATFSSKEGVSITESGFCYGLTSNLSIEGDYIKDDNPTDGVLIADINDIMPESSLYVCSYVYDDQTIAYGVSTKLHAYDVGAGANLGQAANCYIISKSGIYAFDAVKGNSRESVGDVRSVEVLWESFGTSTAPTVGDLIKSVSYSNGIIIFQTSTIFREGNAVIAAKDASGTILWSWHIWLTDEPGECVYANNAGTMMDRNLGATSATPGDVGALGLLYQWGRKDPFLGSSSISGDVEATSTLTWPSPVASSPSRGTNDYAVENPTTFITYDELNYDWYFTGYSSADNTRWQSEKTIYDPCPAGWRVPDGGNKGVWYKAGFDDRDYDDSDEGMLFGSGISSPATWYPAAGCRNYRFGELGGTGVSGRYWSVTPVGYSAYYLVVNDWNVVGPAGEFRSYGESVRCFQE